MSSGVTWVHLPDGTPVWARISDVDQLDDQRGHRAGEQPAGLAAAPTPGQPSEPVEQLPAPRRSSYADAGLGEQLATRVESLKELITGVAASVAAGAAAARPDEVSVSFGIELCARAGRVVGLLADGEAKGAITVTLGWHGAPPEPLGEVG